MMGTWNLGELRRHIYTMDNNCHWVIEVVNSIGTSSKLFDYHLFSAKDALKGITNDTNPSSLENVKLIFGASNSQKEFAYAKLVSEAHLIGCISTVRNSYDIFSQLINALVLEQKLLVKDCNIHIVADELNDGDLKTKIKELLEFEWFKYLSAFSNTAKHRRLVQHDFSVSFQDNITGIKIGAFEYKGIKYPSYWANEVLAGTLEAKNKIICCGKELNLLVNKNNFQAHT